MKDNRLMRRLLRYAKPYTLGFVIIFMMMLISTGAELIKPIIIGNAVDLFVGGYKTPFIQTSESESSLLFEGNYYTHAQADATEVSQVIYYKDTYYWLEAIPGEQSKAILEASPKTFSGFVQEADSTQITLMIEGESCVGRRLTSEELGVIRSVDFKPLLLKGLYYLVCLVLGFLFVYLQTILLQQIGQKIIKRIRQDIYDKMLSLPTRYYHQNPVGALMTRVTNDTESLNDMYTSVITNLLKHTLFLVGILIMMFQTNAKITCYIVAVLPVVVIATMIFKTISRKAYREARAYLTQMNIFLAEHLAGMRLIQIFTREKAVHQKMDAINEKYFRAGLKELYAFMIYRPSLFAMSNLTVALVLLVGAHDVLAGLMSVGAVVILISYTKDFFGPIEELAEVFNILQSAFAAAEKIFAVLDEENEIVPGVQCIDGPTFKGEIEFKNVWFAYHDEEWILKDVSFKIEAGQKVAFVGATGAGKTSILSLIGRYYDIQKGDILIDGCSIKTYDIASLREQIGQVLQDVFMFTGDIKDNIRLGKQTISDAKIREAAEMVNAHTFIEKLPNQYNEEVKEGGSTLSTGERQLISFARAIAYDPKIFILDEATANIDTETESMIQDALYKMMEGRTTIMVAHRLATIQHADNIIVLNKGELKEMGNHQELLAKKGIYYELYEIALKQQVPKETQPQVQQEVYLKEEA